MRRLVMSSPKVVNDNEVSLAVVFDVPPQGEAHIGESDHRQVTRLCDEVCRRLQHPIIVSVRPHRVGMRNCLSVHLSDHAGKALDLLITLTGNTVWPDDEEYARGARWYINLPDATDMLWLLKALEDITGKEK
ncbi:hypothetical protein [Acerihabitans arboris]|uniref:Uncharacterized protein n=1 Tax=Acerihabitans arboris TaxID=2691583 RepID=A0A845SHB5_9GAMM|nr:hypothetical protein [Acerihabitans arboris]NDL64260.1 hypothetical protein [Acerihabitans arboris]